VTEIYRVRGLTWDGVGIQGKTLLTPLGLDFQKASRSGD
jgi:hypothetical protein